MNMSRLSRVSAIVAGVALLAACTDQAPTPTGLGLAASRGLPFTEGLASPAWQEKAAGLVSQAGFNPQTATHAYPLLGVAQYLAVQRAETAEGGFDVANVASGIGIGAGGRNRLELDRGGFRPPQDRKSTRLNSSHLLISYALFCLEKKKTIATLTS